MPQTAKRIDDMRASMGNQVANDILRRAMAGEPVFHSIEKGMIFGTMNTELTSIIKWSKNGQCYRADPPWFEEALALAATLGIEFERKDMDDHEEAHELARQLRKILAGAKHA